MAERISERRHPLYSDLAAEWEFYRDSVKGGKDYLNAGHLFSHRLESQDDDFDERKKRAYYLNFCDEVVELYTNFIMREKIERPEDDTLEEFRKDVDNRGSSMDTFMKKVSKQSSIYGHIYIIVDTPEIDEEKDVQTKGYQKEKNIRPYCTLISPLQLVDWSADKQGELNWILIEQDEYVDIDPSIDREEITTYKLITRDSWEVFDDEGRPIPGRSGENKLGKVFLETCYHKDIDLDMIGESLIKDIAYINRIIYNWCSCIDEMIERQTFSQLIVPDDCTLVEEQEGADILKKIGTSSIWTFNANSGHAPAFISPDTSNIDTIWGMLIAHVREIHRIAGLTGVSEDLYTAQRSGKSQEYGFLNINSTLASKSANLEKTVNAISKLAYMWYSKDPEKYEPVNYPTKFDVEGLQQFMETSFAIIERELSERLNKELMKKLARKALPVTTDSIRKEIEKEIEEGDGTIEPVGGKLEQMRLDSAEAIAADNREVGQPAKDVGGAAKTTMDKKEVDKSLKSSSKQSKGTQDGKPRK